ncbi:MAG TPA: hypothetical protein ENJ60_09695 [Aeromonadales bacterium]|nr:hypothetical protein [Aeromonadales bacterium]
MYQQELARSGNFLFKIRGTYLSIVVVISVIIAYYYRSIGPFESHQLNEIWYWGGFVIASTGALVRIVTSGYAALGTSGVTKKEAIAAELNTTGPYSIVRNPLYLGRILNFTGLAMLSGSWVYASLVFLLSVLIYERISVYEEEFLRREFGEAHSEWAKEVPFLMPRFHGWKKPRYPFWIRRCIKREDKKINWLFTAVVATDFASRGFDTTKLPDNMFWYYLWGVSMVAFIIVRGLRYLTKTFDGIS